MPSPPPSLRAVRLEALLAVAQTGSVAAAAREVGSSRSVLLRHLDELEVDAGVPLFERSRRGVVLTGAGRRVALGAPPIVEAAEGLARDFAEPRVSPGRFLVALAPGLAPATVSAIWHAGLRLAGRSRFEAVVVPDPVEAVLDGADAAVFFGPEVPDGPWRTAKVASLREGLFATPDYVRKRGAPADLDALDDHRLIHWARAGAAPSTVPLCRGGRRGIQPWLTTNDGWLVLRVTELGSCIGYLPHGPVPGRAGPAPELIPILPDLVGAPATLQVILADRSAPLGRWRSLVDVMRGVFSGR